MLEAMLSGSILILAVLLIRALGGDRLPRRLRYGLWGLVLLRLLLPVSLPESGLSVWNAVPRQETRAARTVPVDTVQYDRLPATVPVADGAQTAGGTAQTGSPARIAAADALHILWFTGSVAVGGWFVVQNLVCAHGLRKRRMPYETDLETDGLPVYVAGGLPSPCLFGLLRPAIYLTPAAAADPETVRFVLAHERTHARHLDHFWPVLRGLALALYWWNPLVWLAAYLSRADCELACDEAVLRELGEENRLAYGRALVGLVAESRAPSGVLRAATTMTGSKKDIKTRLRLIVQNPKPVLPVLLAALACAALAAGCTFTAAKTEGEPLVSAPEPAASAPVEVVEAGEDDGIPASSWAADSLEGAIESMILTENRDKFPEGDFACASYVTLAIKEGERYDEERGEAVETVTVYAMVLYRVFDCPGSGVTTELIDAGGCHGPAVLYLDVRNGWYSPNHYWVPRDGSYYKPDVEKVFGELGDDAIVADALDTQKYSQYQMQRCYAQAVEACAVDTDGAIGRLFETIASEPAMSSAPGDYMAAHDVEHRELLYYGDYTLRYIFQRFLAGGETGLEGHLMRIVMDELCPEGQLRLYAATGQEYFDEWRKMAEQTRNEMGLDAMREQLPGMWLLLTMPEYEDLRTHPVE